MSVDYVGALLRPHAPAMEPLDKYGQPPTHVYDACQQAGRQLVTDGRIEADTLEQVRQPLMPQEVYLNGANEAMRKLRAKYVAREAQRAAEPPA
jgi:hypothetical protein